MSESRHEPERRHGFRRGDHIEVRRLPGYYHHGIYVSAQRVIQFGGGVSDKPGATIEAVSLHEFQRGGSVRVVIHDGRRTATGWLPRADSPDRVVERAEWLLANHPPGRYDLIGNNCEHMANFCVNEYTESPQVRRFFLLKAGVGALFLWWYGAARGSRRLPTVPILVANFASFLITASYNFHIARFWNDVGRKWRANDRAIREEQGGQRHASEL
jgi:HRAS-like suppressor 3